MKRIFITLTLLLSGVMAMQASPVDLSLIQTAAGKFAEAKFAVERQNPELVYTGPEGAFYVFNIGTKGFVIIAADDAYRPVIGYSNESTFDPNNIPPALVDYLNGIATSINRLRRNGNANATPMVAAEWQSLLTKGELLSHNGGRGVDYLVQTQWNQDYPYNYFCPVDPDGSHGHTYVGCLATAMAQLVSFWKMPEHGYGSHCYVHEDYGEICADFQNTYYDWEHIANKINASSPIEEIEAVALISFHCGVTIDMGYGPDGSGGASGPIPGAMHQYYDYSDANIQRARNDYETEVWKTMVREQFDMGWPMYYGGCESDGCHAFVCDGYDDKDMFHFNLGWGGGSDGWYLIDDAPYTHPADAMFNFVPSEIYNMTSSAPADFTVNVPSETQLSAELHWTNPTTSLDGTALSTIEELVVMRNNSIVHTFENVTPGATMDWTDTEVPYFGKFHYAVYAKANGRYGKHADAYVTLGPSCQWKFMMTAQNFQGWNGGYITVYNSAGHEVANCSLSSGSQQTEFVTLPLGMLYFSWTAPQETVENMGLVIRDTENNMVYSFSGSSDELSGCFLEANNGCGSASTCEVPQNVVAFDNGEDPILLTWDAVGGNIYGYNVFRDNVLCRMVQSGTSFLDEQAGIGGHCYQVSVVCEGGESQKSNLTCATEGPCYPPRNFSCEFTTNHKLLFTWEAPVETEGLSVYGLYRRSEGGEYPVRPKLLDHNSVSYQYNNAMVPGDYYFQLKGWYDGEVDCISAPANIKDEPNVFELHVRIEPMDVEEYFSTLTIAPNPTDGTVIITGNDLQEVVVYNITGQTLVKANADSDSMSIDLRDYPAGLYFVHVMDRSGNGCVRKLVKQ